LSKLPTPVIHQYKVFRGDSFSYETVNVDDVVAEDNSDWRRITRLEILAAHAGVFSFKQSFGKDGVTLEISGDDRDAVFLLFSDIREYTVNEVLTHPPLSRDTARFAGMLLTFLVMMGFFYSTVYRPMVAPWADTDSVLQSSDLADKLNYLIQDKERSRPGSSTIVWFGALILATLLGTSGAVQTAWGLVFPSNIFLFGKQKAQFDRRRGFLARIFWVVVVGIVVSAIGSLIVWRVTTH
jgi:hypothetical protein